MSLMDALLLYVTRVIQIQLSWNYGCTCHINTSSVVKDVSV